MMNNAIEILIEKEFSRISNFGSDNSLAYGAMGVALFMVWYGKEYHKEEFIKRGVELIEKKCINLTSSDSLDLHKGQTGIGIGIFLLHRCNIIEGNIVKLLTELDDNVFRGVANSFKFKAEHVATLIDVSFYIALRLRYNSYDEINSKIYTRLLSKIINSIFPQFCKDIFIEPYPGGYSYNLPKFLILLSLSLGNNFDQRILRIAEEIQPLVLSQCPYMVSNRLALSNAIHILGKSLNLNCRWHEFADLIFNSITSDQINMEFTRHQISCFNGLGWLALQEIIAFNIQGKTIHRDVVISKMTDPGILKLTHKELIGKELLGLYGIFGYIIIYHQIMATLV